MFRPWRDESVLERARQRSLSGSARLGNVWLMGKKQPAASPKGKASALLDTPVIYCGDNLEQLAKLPEKCIDLIYIDPPLNPTRNYEVFWGETKKKRAFEDRHENTKAYIDYMRP